MYLAVMPEEKLVFPKVITDRLELGQLDHSHIPAMFEIFSSEEAMRYYDITPFTKPEQCKELIDLFNRRFEEKNGLRWGIFFEDQLIGTCGFNGFNKRKGVIGYDINPAFWNRGFATEAVKAIVEFGMYELLIHRIEAYTSVGNVGSEKVLLKIGFEREGLLKDVSYFKDAYHDQYLFAKVNRPAKRQ